MPPTLQRRDECDDFGTNCPQPFRPTNYAIIIAAIFIVISLASCVILRGRRRRRRAAQFNAAQPRLQHYSNGPLHIAEFIRLPPPPAGFVAHPAYQLQQQRPPVFEPAPPYDPTKGPPPLPPSSVPPPPPPPILPPAPTHAAVHDPLQAVGAGEPEQRSPPGGPMPQLNVPPMEYPPPLYSR